MVGDHMGILGAVVCFLFFFVEQVKKPALNNGLEENRVQNGPALKSLEWRGKRSSTRKRSNKSVEQRA
jgi:formate hydrogenlyase subunit 4